MRSAASRSSLALLAGLGLIFLAERVIAEGGAALALRLVGTGAVLGATLWRLSRWRGADAEARRIERYFLLADLGVALSLGLYALGRVALGPFSVRPEAQTEGALLGVLWPALLGVSLTTLIWMEAAWAASFGAGSAERRRVRDAAYAGLGISLALVAVFSFNYAASVRDVRWDLSYFKTTEPSEGSLQLTSELAEPLRLVLLFPPGNEVLRRLRPYAEGIASASAHVRLEERDQALAPILASRHGLRTNGLFVLIRGEGETEEAASIEIGLELEVARSRLRSLDGRFREAFAHLMTQRRVLHVSAGHEERSASGRDGEAPGARIERFHQGLRRGNISVRNLGMAQGLAQRVPEGAPAVAVIGPRRPFLPEEADSLLRYVREGGRLVVMVDPGDDHGLEPLLAGLGLELLPGSLASEEQHRSRTHTIADRGRLYTNTYSTHATSSSVVNRASEIATVFDGAGKLQRLEGATPPRGLSLAFPVRIPEVVWRDLDGDFERDADEPLEDARMIAALSLRRPDGREGRAVIIADADFVSDALIVNRGNAIVFSDIAQWLMGREEIVAEVTTEEDVPIEHSRAEDKLWFYGTSLGIPMPLLGLGLLVAIRRRRRRPAPESAAKGTAEPEPGPEGGADPVEPGPEPGPEPADADPAEPEQRS